ncbi:hypothetical protein A3SI_12564 [Nitritalea halalkaliphila LW7]|uniref:Uncharacterized protein n=1 Tax=Nitritalea halalkaliphila LW7 TaxID=1189621 RepID=I5C1I0_9BACT|nr:hypothetical protein [Nitritalea halalkaliphila]EIM75682.1 hypothetical protein A3SI_12564 [Nitritalea halalkaliphila LW7]
MQFIFKLPARAGNKSFLHQVYNPIMQNDYQEALQHTLSLLKQEWAADLALYKTKFLSSSIAEKKRSRHLLVSRAGAYQ